MNLANTRQLFLELLPKLKVNLVCDVGSMNGAESLGFRAVLPNATIFAFEANPLNVARMQEDQTLRAANIEIVPLAVTDFDGDSTLFVVDASEGPPDHRRGMSSLYERDDPSLVQSPARVATTRLDTFLTARDISARNIAVWLDVEGKAYEVLVGSSRLLPGICLVHVEVETRPCIAPGQRLEHDISDLLIKHGFSELARDSDQSPPQLNLIFIRADLPPPALRHALRSTRVADAKFRLRRLVRSVRTRIFGP
jgi:FkbM family methyltransferase